MLNLALVTLAFWFIASITLALLAGAVMRDSNPLDDDAEAEPLEGLGEDHKSLSATGTIGRFN